MLILSRQLGEKIYVTFPGQEPVIITVAQIRGQIVKLGITANNEIGVDREEVYHDKLKKQRELPGPEHIPLRKPDSKPI